MEQACRDECAGTVLYDPEKPSLAMMTAGVELDSVAPTWEWDCFWFLLN